METTMNQKKVKVIPEQIIPSRMIGSCYQCDFYFTDSLGDSRFCKKVNKEVDLRIGEKFPKWCPLEEKEIDENIFL